MDLINTGLRNPYIVTPIVLLICYSIYHVIKNHNLSKNEKIIMVVLLLLANVGGMIVYWIFGRKANTSH